VPELPEVERYRSAAEAVLSRTITSVTSPDAWFLKGGVTGAVLERALLGHAFTSVRRIGKLLLLYSSTSTAGPPSGSASG
jgi:formamidopyrimidine-DNA glycosylase